MRPILIAAAAVLCGAGSQACSGAAAPGPPNPPPETKAMTSPDQAPSPATDLPFAGGQTFATLDDYLAHLRRRSAYDVPYYREVSPGVYERVTGRGARGQAPRQFTREDLERKYGFSP